MVLFGRVYIYKLYSTFSGTIHTAVMPHTRLRRRRHGNGRASLCVCMRAFLFYSSRSANPQCVLCIFKYDDIFSIILSVRYRRGDGNQAVVTIGHGTVFTSIRSLRFFKISYSFLFFFSIHNISNMQLHTHTRFFMLYSRLVLHLQ